MGLPTPWAERTEIMPAAVGPDEEAVRAAIDRGERTVDALVAHLGLHAGRIQAALLGLEIAGEILVLPGGAVVPL
jgi:predicted Rossmann fold nucleotide-binding protein DprA/Smf involved in DNA uptake